MASASPDVTPIDPSFNSQLFKLTYGALVDQLMNFCDNAEDVNEQLDSMGYQVGVKIIHDFMARTSTTKCTDMRETAEKIQSAFKIYLDVEPTVTNWSSVGDEFSLLFDQNPLTEFVRLPESCLNIKYCNLFCGMIRGGCEMVQLEVTTWFVQDSLKGDPATELRVKFVKKLGDLPTEESF